MAEGQGENIAIWNSNTALEKMLEELNTNNEFQLYLTGAGNFRYTVYPEYKGNRVQPRPAHLMAVKQHLKEKWGAAIAEGCEADDLISVDACQANKEGREVLLVHVDKDLDQIPGVHYQWKMSGQVNGKRWVKEARRYHISPLDGLRFFYTQLLTGDRADNIKGVKGIGPAKAEKILEGLTEECDLLNAVRNYYSSDEELLMNGQCLWLWKEMNGTWKIPSGE